MTSFTPTFYALDRDTDVSGVSGTGRVAYVLPLPFAGVIQLWDTTFDVGKEVEEHSQGIEWLPHLPMLRRIHTYNGQTRLTPIDEDRAALARAEVLLDNGIAQLEAALRELRMLRETDPRTRARQRLIDAAIARATALGKTIACQSTDMRRHATCIGLRATMNEGLGCLCACHDGQAPGADVNHGDGVTGVVA